MLKPANKIINKLMEKEKELNKLNSDLLLDSVPPKCFEKTRFLLEIQSQIKFLNNILPELKQIIEKEEN